MKKELMELSFGAGEDSTTILYKIAFDKAFKDSYVKVNYFF